MAVIYAFVITICAVLFFEFFENFQAMWKNNWQMALWLCVLPPLALLGYLILLGYCLKARDDKVTLKRGALLHQKLRQVQNQYL